ncbi:hypothetical protein BVRB_7g176650 [Beta vulgaris subsp. vulgaris]|nr:hypothetical protein BVRB_7g176650 [Beta vulgaris subsp. vulgaris]
MFIPVQPCMQNLAEISCMRYDLGWSVLQVMNLLEFIKLALQPGPIFGCVNAKILADKPDWLWT